MLREVSGKNPADMKLVQFHRYWVTAPGRKREYLTSFVMDAETAEKQYPGARAEPSSRVERMEPETEQERLKLMYRYQSAGHDSVKPPGKDPE